MKSAAVAVLMMWMCFSTEFSGPKGIPDHSVILPAACAVMFWFGNSTGVLIGGIALLVDWIVRPTTLPLVAAFVPTIAVVLLNQQTRQTDFRRRRLPGLPQGLRLPLLTLSAVTLHLMSSLSAAAFSNPLQTLAHFRTEWLQVMLIAAPLSIAASLAVYMAHELGLRRSGR